MTLWPRSISSRSRSDFWLSLTTYGCAFFSGLIILFLFGFLVKEAWLALSEIPLHRFLTDKSWYPLSDQFNLLPMIAATACVSLGAICLAGPAGIGAAIFCEFYAPRIWACWFRRLIELLAGIPSVVLGLWGLVELAPLIAQIGGSGQSLLTAIFVLAFMIFPTVALTSHAALRAVPTELIQGGAALGLNRWSIIRRIAVPATSRGMWTGTILAIARAVGETMAVLMVAGNVAEFPNSPLAPVRTLTANIALEMGYATRLHRSILFVSGLVLMIIVAGAILLIEVVGGRQRE